MRYAEISGGEPDVVATYLPSNYEVVGVAGNKVIIAGTDDHGWTLDDYVLPRLASGLRIGTELVRV